MLCLSGEYVFLERCLRVLFRQHGVGGGQRGVPVQTGLYRCTWRVRGVSGGDVQARGGDVGVPELSGEQRVGERKCSVCLCSRVYGLALFYVFLRADSKSLDMHDFYVPGPLAASRRLRRLAHDVDGEEVRVDVLVTARVLCELT